MYLFSWLGLSYPVTWLHLARAQLPAPVIVNWYTVPNVIWSSSCVCKGIGDNPHLLLMLVRLQVFHPGTHSLYGYYFYDWKNICCGSRFGRWESLRQTSSLGLQSHSLRSSFTAGDGRMLPLELPL